MLYILMITQLALIGTVVVIYRQQRELRRLREPDPVATDPKWKDRLVYMPTDVLLELASPQRLAEIRRRSLDRLEEVGEEMEENGIDHPLTLVVDESGKIALKDGHTRLLNAAASQRPWLPIRLKTSTKIRSHGRSSLDMLEPLLLGARDGARAQKSSRVRGRPRGRQLRNSGGLPPSQPSSTPRAP